MPRFRKIANIWYFIMRLINAKLFTSTIAKIFNLIFVPQLVKAAHAVYNATTDIPKHWKNEEKSTT